MTIRKFKLPLALALSWISIPISLKNRSTLTRILLTSLLVSLAITGDWRSRVDAAQGGERPLALATGDFDEDGMADLLSGYASGGAGSIRLHRGHIAAVYPNSPEARRSGAGDDPFLPARDLTLPARPDFIGAGDFDADGHLDAVVADSNGEHLHWLSGDGRGGFAEAQAVALPGQVNRADGLADVIVGVNGAGGPQLLVFEGADGALRRAPEIFALPAAASGFALGHFDDDGMIDLAVAAGERLLIVHGRDRRLSLDRELRAAVPPAQIDERDFPAPVAAVAAGDFTGDPRVDLAVLTADGAAQVLENQQTASTGASRAPVKPIAQWTAREIFRLPNTQSLRLDDEKAPLLVAARLSSSPHEQLIMGDDSSRRLFILNGEDGASGRLALSHSKIGEGVAAIDLTGEPLAVLPLRLNSDALSDLAIMQTGAPALTFARTAAQTTFTVTNTNDSGAGSSCSAKTLAPSRAPAQ